MNKKLLFLFLFLFPVRSYAAMNFNGTTQFVDVGTPALNGAAKITESLWFFRTSATDTGFMGPYISATNGLQIAPFSDGNVYVTARNGGNEYSFVAFAQTGWHHFALVYDGTQGSDATKLLLYIDGIQQTLTAGIAGFPATVSWTDTNFNRDFSGADRFGNMPMDDVRLYNRALSSSEVKSLALSRSRLLITTGIVGWWKLNDGIPQTKAVGATILDRSGNGLTGTAFNSPTWAGSFLTNP